MLNFLFFNESVSNNIFFKRIIIDDYKDYKNYSWVSVYYFSVDNIAEHLVDFSFTFACTELRNHIFLVFD